MFKSKNKMARNNEVNPDAINRIVEGTKIEGDMVSESSIRIDGSFVGNITTKGRLVIGETGKVVGNIKCQDAEIIGHLKGEIYVQKLLSLKSTALLDGDIYTDKLAIEPGSEFTGTCKMGKVKDIKSNDKERQAEERTA